MSSLRSDAGEEHVYVHVSDSRSLTWRFRRLTDSNQVLVGLLEQLNASVSRLVVLKEIEISDRWPEVAYLLLVRLSKEPGFSRA